MTYKFHLIDLRTDSVIADVTEISAMTIRTILETYASDNLLASDIGIELIQVPA